VETNGKRKGTVMLWLSAPETALVVAAASWSNQATGVFVRAVALREARRVLRGARREIALVGPNLKKEV
jgi:hypothetical protein